VLGPTGAGPPKGTPFRGHALREGSVPAEPAARSLAAAEESPGPGAPEPQTARRGNARGTAIRPRPRTRPETERSVSRQWWEPPAARTRPDAGGFLHRGAASGRRRASVDGQANEPRRLVFPCGEMGIPRSGRVPFAPCGGPNVGGRDAPAHPARPVPARRAGGRAGRAP